MKKPSKTTAEIEAAIKVEMKDIWTWRTEQSEADPAAGAAGTGERRQGGAVRDDLADRRSPERPIRSEDRSVKRRLGANSHPDNFLSRAIGNENEASMPPLILRQLVGNDESVRRGFAGVGKNRPGFVRIAVAVVDVEIEPASFSRDPGVGFVEYDCSRKRTLEMTAGCVPQRDG